MDKIQRQRAWECGLPAYLQHDLDAYKEGLRTGSTLIDCLWCELYGSINGAEIDDQAINNKKINYFDFLHASDMPQGLRSALDQLLQRIQALDFHALVDSTPYLTPLQRQFYIQYLTRRRQIMFSDARITMIYL